MPLSSEGPSRTFRQNALLAILLAGVAGAVNAGGFFVLGLHTSHMTGQVAAVGEAVATGRVQGAKDAAKLVGAFVLGAATAAMLLDLMQQRRRGRYVPALAVEALVLLAGTFWALQHPAVRVPGLASVFCFAMGLQNAIVTRISGAIVRTTHLTGVLTDFGMELIRIFRWLTHELRRHGLRDAWRVPTALVLGAEFERAWLHLTLIISFFSGATLGTWLHRRTAEAALGAPTVVLLGLIILDLRAPRAGASAVQRVAEDPSGQGSAARSSRSAP